MAYTVRSKPRAASQRKYVNPAELRYLSVSGRNGRDLATDTIDPYQSRLISCAKGKDTVIPDAFVVNVGRHTHSLWFGFTTVHSRELLT